MKISYLADHPDESAKIAQWYFDEWGHRNQQISYETVLDKVSSKAISRKGFPLAFIIHDHDDLVAAVELKIQENKDFPQYEHWLGGVYVLETERGKGYAEALISKAKAHVETLGITALYLQCQEHNLNLYRKYGFRALHEASHDGVKTTIMVWEKST